MLTLTQRTCTIYTFIHQIYANHSPVAHSDYSHAEQYFRTDI